MAQTVSFSSDRISDAIEVLTLNGVCDLSTALDAEQRIGSAVDAGRTEIIFDLRGVDQFRDLIRRLEARGCSPARIEKIMGLNFLAYADRVW